MAENQSSRRLAGVPRLLSEIRRGRATKRRFSRWFRPLRAKVFHRSRFWAVRPADTGEATHHRGPRPGSRQESRAEYGGTLRRRVIPPEGRNGDWECEDRRSKRDLRAIPLR